MSRRLSWTERAGFVSGLFDKPTDAWDKPHDFRPGIVENGYQVLAACKLENCGRGPTDAIHTNQKPPESPFYANLRSAAEVKKTRETPHIYAYKVGGGPCTECGLMASEPVHIEADIQVYRVKDAGDLEALGRQIEAEDRIRAEPSVSIDCPVFVTGERLRAARKERQRAATAPKPKKPKETGTELDIDCPTCKTYKPGGTVGKKCKRPSGHAVFGGKSHDSRIKAWKQIQDAKRQDEEKERWNRRYQCLSDMARDNASEEEMVAMLVIEDVYEDLARRTVSEFLRGSSPRETNRETGSVKQEDDNRISQTHNTANDDVDAFVTPDNNDTFHVKHQQGEAEAPCLPSSSPSLPSPQASVLGSSSGGAAAPSTTPPDASGGPTTAAFAAEPRASSASHRTPSASPSLTTIRFAPRKSRARTADKKAAEQARNNAAAALLSAFYDQLGGDYQSANDSRRGRIGNELHSFREALKVTDRTVSGVAAETLIEMARGYVEPLSHSEVWGPLTDTEVEPAFWGLTIGDEVAFVTGVDHLTPGKVFKLGSEIGPGYIQIQVGPDSRTDIIHVHNTRIKKSEVADSDESPAKEMVGARGDAKADPDVIGYDAKGRPWKTWHNAETGKCGLSYQAADGTWHVEMYGRSYPTPKAAIEQFTTRWDARFGKPAPEDPPEDPEGDSIAAAVGLGGGLLPGNSDFPGDEPTPEDHTPQSDPVDLEPAGFTF